MSSIVAGEEMIIMPLGGGQEVGRSCILLQYRNRNILLDCGGHPGRDGNDSLPFFDMLDNPEDIDMILITHFHIDHCASLPYFTEKTNFKGKVYMTHATKAVMKLLLSDNIKLQAKQNQLYNEQDLQNCVDKVDTIDFHQTIEFKGVKVTATAAGHVLGAAMFLIDIDNIKILYTGDYSMEEDRHLSKAELPQGAAPDVLIVESTFGTTNLNTREEREAGFTRAVENIVNRGGSCLIPVFALGRAQELLLILDEHWKASPELQDVPIYYASRLASRSLKVYQTFVNMMNDHVRSQAESFDNPFRLKHIKAMTSSDQLERLGPCVVMASPGFLQSGVSRELFENWCDDERHGVIIAGYTIEGTLAHDLLSMPSEVKCLDNRIKPRRCQVEHISFSAHVDYNQNRSFIRSVCPDYIVLVHGEATGMRRLKEALEGEIQRGWPTQHKPSIATPDNGTKVKLRFKKNIIADVMGSAAVSLLKAMDNTPLVEEGALSLPLPPQTLLVTENFTTKLVQAGELSQFSSCRLGVIKERMILPVPQDISQLLLVDSPDTDYKAHALDQIEQQLLRGFYEVERSADTISIQGIVSVQVDFFPDLKTLSAVVISWDASPLSDVLADSTVALLTQFLSAPNLVRRAVEQGMYSRRGRNVRTEEVPPAQRRKIDESNVEIAAM